MKIIITLNGTAGELDRKDLYVDDTDDASVAIHDAIEDWILSPGDTITIREA